MTSTSPSSVSNPEFIFADYLLSGVFTGDLHRIPELQYGYWPSGNHLDDTDPSKRLKSLTGHINTFTARNLTNTSDSLTAFFGIGAAFSTASESFPSNSDNAAGTSGNLALIMGIPLRSGTFADGSPALQHSFALSLSMWVHSASPRVRHRGTTPNPIDEEETDEQHLFDKDNDKEPKSELYATTATCCPELPFWT